MDYTCMCSVQSAWEVTASHDAILRVRLLKRSSISPLGGITVVTCVGLCLWHGIYHGLCLGFKEGEM